MDVKERIYEFCKETKIPIRQFEIQAKLSNGYVSSMRKGLGRGKLENVLKAFPDISREWLLYGEGEMLVQMATEEPAPIEVLQAKIDKLEAAIEEYKTTVERLVGSLSKQITDALQVVSNK